MLSFPFGLVRRAGGQQSVSPLQQTDSKELAWKGCSLVNSSKYGCTTVWRIQHRGRRCATPWRRTVVQKNVIGDRSLKGADSGRRVRSLGRRGVFCTPLNPQGRAQSDVQKLCDKNYFFFRTHVVKWSGGRARGPSRPLGAAGLVGGKGGGGGQS